MKKLSKITLGQGSVLQNEEMKKILGGGSYTCYCSGQNYGFLVNIPDWEGGDAAYEIGRQMCGSSGLAYCDRNP